MPKVGKLCKSCGKPFLADSRELKRGNAEYCSLSCVAKAPKKLQQKQVCKHCGTGFMSASKNAKYCSYSCKQKNYRAKQKGISKDGFSIKYYYKLFKNTPCELCQWDKTSRDLHHIIEVANGGTTELNNLMCVCPNCHRMIHANLISENDLRQIIENRTISSSCGLQELDA